MRDRIDANDLSLGSHSIDDYAIDPVSKRLFYAGSSVEEHIQDLCRSFVWVLRLQDVIATLHEVSPCVLLGSDQHTVDLGIVVRLVPAKSLILENQKEAPGQRFSGSNILDQPDVILTQLLALLIILIGHLFTKQRNVLIRISLSGNGLKLQAHR